MRLVNTRTLLLEEFVDYEIPGYSILSHTWGKEEVTFKDMTEGLPPVEKAGYSKVTGSCRMALADGYGYIWIDTCCIDKSSSAELSEAINSMYEYYALAMRYYVYLADVDHNRSTDSTADLHVALRKSRWFTRGWTLQELIAPSSLSFLSSTWAVPGEIDALVDGECNALVDTVSSITGIEEEVFLSHQLQYSSIAQRMSWAARRQTTRAEDSAYCLLGLFDVNMPLLYGEGRQRAFYRLQQEIIKEFSDHSIFAWRWLDNPSKNSHLTYETSGLLATSLAAFADAGNIVTLRLPSPRTYTYAMTNQGLHITLRLTRGFWDHLYIAYLDCMDQTKGDTIIRIYLHKSPGPHDQFKRAYPSELLHTPFPKHVLGSITRDLAMYVKQTRKPSYTRKKVLRLAEGGRIHLIEKKLSKDASLKSTIPSSLGQHHKVPRLDPGIKPEGVGFTAALLYQHSAHLSLPGLIVVIWLDNERNIWCQIIPEALESLDHIRESPVWPLSRASGLICAYTHTISETATIHLQATLLGSRMISWQYEQLDGSINDAGLLDTTDFDHVGWGREEEDVYVIISGQTNEQPDHLVNARDDNPWGYSRHMPFLGE